MCTSVRLSFIAKCPNVHLPIPSYRLSWWWEFLDTTWQTSRKHALKVGIGWKCGIRNQDRSFMCVSRVIYPIVVKMDRDREMARQRQLYQRKDGKPIKLTCGRDMVKYVLPWWLLRDHVWTGHRWSLLLTGVDICMPWQYELVTVEIKDLYKNGCDGYYGSVDILMVSQFGGRWNLSQTYRQNGFLHHLLTCWLRRR